MGVVGVGWCRDMWHRFSGMRFWSAIGSRGRIIVGLPFVVDLLVGGRRKVA